MRTISLELTWDAVLERAGHRAQNVDASGLWPFESLLDLQNAGATRWAVPLSAGGADMDTVELHRRYEELAAECLTTALIWTQRDSAVKLLAGSPPSPRIAQVLAQLVDGSAFATIGISQLATSGLHLPPPITAEPTSKGYILRGTVPWCTGAAFADYVLTGAHLPGDHNTRQHQLLVLLPTNLNGVEIRSPLKLAALNGTYTSQLALHGVKIPADDVLRGPSDGVLAADPGAFGLPTCVLPLGVARGALLHAERLAEGRGRHMLDAVDRLASERRALAEQIYAVGSHPGQYHLEEIGPRLRAAVDLLAIRAALTALSLAKGAGFTAESPAQRRAREAMFFYVWSSPDPIMACTLQLLGAPPPDPLRL